VSRAIRAESESGLERILAVTLESRGLLPLEQFALLRCGAGDVLAWDESGHCAERIVARLLRWQAVDELLASEAVRGSLLGESACWTRALRQVVEIAAFSDAPLLILGETGTGKELVARLVHALDPRPDKGDFVVLDCTTIVDSLSGSEFFGHEKGAFTGAVAPRSGAFALADGGTLFLDEVGELPLALQAELLRVVQEQTFKRVGGNAWQTTDFRLICATHRQIEAERGAGRFRSDLLYRISGSTVTLPPLRERTEDIPLLVRQFLAEQLKSAPELDDAVRYFLMQRDYPGNVRELRQLVSRIAYRHVGPGPISVGDLGSDATGVPVADADDWCGTGFRESIVRAVSQGVGLKDIGRVAEDLAVRCAIASENGSLQNAARRLGVTDRALQLRRAAQRASETPVPKSA
jgi:transcriptional regulator with GAF, ATPase, and Fis domain